MAANPDCPACQGAGWKHAENGGVVRCGCSGDVGPDERVRKLGLPRKFAAVGFDNFRAGTPYENAIEYNLLTGAMSAAKKFAEEYPFGPKRGLLFQGSPGVGKTHLAVAALKRLAERGFDCIFFRLPDAVAENSRGLRPGGRGEQPRNLPRRARNRGAAAGRSGRAPRDRLGARYGSDDHQPPLQRREGAHRHHQPAGGRVGA